MRLANYKVEVEKEGRFGLVEEGVVGLLVGRQEDPTSAILRPEAASLEEVRYLETCLACPAFPLCSRARLNEDFGVRYAGVVEGSVPSCQCLSHQASGPEFREAFLVVRLPEFNGP
jgi:hypothetical protein